MPFTEVSKNEISVSATKRVPIFFIPGITGQSAELLHLIAYLKENAFNYQIYVWEDPRLAAYKNEFKEEENILSITKLSSIISEEISSILTVTDSPADTPCAIIGYSFGGILSVTIAQQLKKTGKLVAPCVIDTPSPQSLKRHFNDKEAKQDFFTIMMYANQLSPDFNSLLIYSMIATQNLQSLNQEILKTDPKLDNLHTIMTSQTIDKYKCSTKGDWEEFANNISSLLLRGNHAAPLEKANAEFIAENIISYLNSYKMIPKIQNKRQLLIDIESPPFSPSSKNSPIRRTLSQESDTSPSASDDSSPFSSPATSPHSGYDSEEEKLPPTVRNKLVIIPAKESKPQTSYKNILKSGPKLFINTRNTRSNRKNQVNRLTVEEDSPSPRNAG